MTARYFLLAAAMNVTAFAQVSSNASLTGKYFFREVLLITDGTANVTDTRTGLGTLTFDGSGNFTISATQLVGTAASATLSGNGTYVVKPGGFVTLSNPLRSGVVINARLGQGALVGSSTEAGNTVFDLFTAIPAPTQTVSAATLNGAYWISSLELPNGGTADIRSTNFKLTANGAGSFAESTVTGQAANLQNNLQSQTVGPITYSLSGDGTGTFTFPTAAGLTNTTQLISGVKTMYVAQDGSYFIGGSAVGGGHGLIVGVRAFANTATNASWSGFYFAAGMRYDTASSGFSARLAGVAASVHAIGDGNAAWARRTRQSDGIFDAAPLITYSLSKDGSGPLTSTPGHVDLASNGKVFSTTSIDVASTTSYEIYFGALMQPQSGTGVFLNPQGVYNSGSFAPPGYPIAPGTFITLFGTGFGSQTAKATLPIPPILAGVQVSINGTPAPVYSVTGGSSASINAIVPYAVTGSTATIVVTVAGAKSNSVDVPLAATAPGVFSILANGISDAAARHGDGSLISSSNPATRGEFIAVYLGGLGPVTPTITDGIATPATPNVLYRMNGPVNVYVGGQLAATPLFAGLTPTLAGLYQINFQVPLNIGSGYQSLAVQTNEAFTDMVSLWVQ